MDIITSKANRRLHMLTQCKRAAMPSDDIRTMYVAKIRPVLEYACPAWHAGLCGYLEKDIERVQKRAMKIMYPKLCYEKACEACKLPLLKERREKICMKFFRSMEDPKHKLNHLIPVHKAKCYKLRNDTTYNLNKTKTQRADGSLINWFLNKHL